MNTRSIVLATVAATCALAPATAGAQAVDRGDTTIVIGKSAARSMKAAGIRMTVTKPVTYKGGELSLPVSRGILSGGSRYLEHGGTITFKRGRRTVRFTGLRTTLARSARVTAVTGGKRTTLFVTTRRAELDSAAGTAMLLSTPTTIPATLARTLRRKLGRGVPRSLGTVIVKAALRGAGSVTAPSSAPPAAPAPAPAPPAATPVPNPTITWHLRDSLVRYLASGDGESDGTIVSGGAAEGAPTVRAPSAEPLVYDFTYAPSGKPSFVGSPLSTFFGEGALRLSYPQHTIDIVVAEPEIELNGAASRGIFKLDGNTVAPQSRGQRTVLMTLDAAAVTPTEAPVAGGTRVTYERIPAKVSPEGSTVLQGYYQPGDDFGAVTVSYTR